MSTLLDENAFGVLVSYYDIENDEYALAPEEFLDRCAQFRAVIMDAIGGVPAELEPHAIDLGHAVYMEVAEVESSWDALAFLRDVRGRLNEIEIPTIGVISHGSRWVPEHPDGVDDRQMYVAATLVQRASRMSEPLRRALYADTAAQAASDDEPGWGPGTYVDTEALEAMGRKLKNAPTPLASASATFYRVGK